MPGIVFLMVVPLVTDLIEFTDHLNGLIISEPAHSITTPEKVRGCFDTLIAATAVRALAGIIYEALQKVFRGYFPKGA
jgi:hypothetical protein